jgi:hypothetical protein
MYVTTRNLPRPYPKERKLQVTDSWRQEVDRWLAEHGHDRQWLSRAIKADPATVKRTLDAGGSNTSSLVSRIVELTGLPFPVRESGAEWEDEMISRLRTLSASQREMIRRLTDDPASLEKLLNLLKP